MTYLKVPIEVACEPSTGYVYVGYHWWVVDGHFIVLYSWRVVGGIQGALGSSTFDVNEDLSVQANRDRRVVERIHPGADIHTGTIFMGSVARYLREHRDNMKELVYVHEHAT